MSLLDIGTELRHERYFDSHPRVGVTFPAGNPALILVGERLRHVAGAQWGNKKYMNKMHL